MNKTKSFSLILLLAAVSFSSCYNSSETNTKMIQKTDKSTPYSENLSPSPDKSVAPANTTISKAGSYDQAVSDYNSKNYEKAATGFQEVIKSNPQNSQAHFYLGRSYQALKKDDDAINAFKEAVKVNPKYAEANFELGNIYFSRKNYETSLPFYQAAVKANYKSTEMLMALGDNYRLLQNPQSAIVQYNNIIGFEPRNAMARYNVGLTYIALKNKLAAQQQVKDLQPLDANLAKKLQDAINQ